jgi:ribonuclease J
LAKERVKVISLGGVAEIGKNMTVFEYKDDIIIVDVGVGFPEEDMLGIDLVIPDITYLQDKLDRIRGIVITHGHEDHIGSLPYLLPQLNAPVYATRLTAGMIAGKLKESRLLEKTQLNVVKPGDSVKLGAFEVEFFHVCHSIPDGAGLIIRTPVGTLVHSGDFKLDQTPVDGMPTDYGRLAELGSEQVLALFSDCVHVEAPGYTPSEKVVGQTFERIFRAAEGRIIVATFASLISRVQQVIEVSAKLGRKVAVIGRSLENNVAIATELGYLDVPNGVLIKASEAAKLPPDQVTFVVTGSQGEPMAVLNRIANQDQAQIKIIPGDTVVVSANPIPGNETSVARIINSLFQQGANVVYGALDTVHVSGHASREELKLLINLVRPLYCVPVHGEYRMMVLYKKMAMEMGYPENQILLPDVGHVMEFGKDYGKITGKVKAGYVFVDGVTVGDIGHVVVRDRQLLSKDGMLMVVVTVDRKTGQVVAGPDIVSRGFIYMREATELIESTKEKVRAAIDHNGDVPAEWSFLNQKIKETVSEFLYQKTRRRPMVLPVVMEV